MVNFYRGKVVPAVLMVMLLLLMDVSIFAQQKSADGEQALTRQEAAMEKLRGEVNARSRSEVTVALTRRGDITTLEGNLSEPMYAKTTNRAALDFLEENKGVFQIRDINRELSHQKTRQDRFGLEHTTFSQLYEGLPVYKRTMTVHFNTERRVHAVTSNFISNLDLSSTAASVSERNAVLTAKGDFANERMLLEESQLMVYFDDFHQQAHLVYAVSIANFKVDKTVMVNAETGEILREFTHRHSSPVNGSGTDAFGSNVNPLHIYQGTDFPIPNNATWQSVMGSAAKGNYNMVDLVHTGLGNIYGLDSRHTDLTTIDFIYNNTSTFSSSNQTHRAGVSGAVNFEATLDYFKVKFDRNGIDDAGMPVIHIQDWYDPANPINAFWSGGLGYMAFSLGGTLGGTTYRPLSAATDVVAHELAHGVTDRTSGLIYQNHSGALNEAWSDMYGYLVEAYQQGSYNEWLLGEDVYQSPPSAFRSLSDPTQFGDPDNINHPAYQPPVGNPNSSNDYGGVHSNSGIPNKMFQLLVAGGTHYGIQVDAFDSNIQTSADLVSALMYLANTGGYFTANSTFDDARSQTLAACAALYPGDNAKYTAVQNAWASVGIGSVPQPPATYATLPYTTGFESGSLDDSWNTASSSSFGRIQVTSANTPYAGSYHLTMDVTTNGNYSQNEAWLHLNLSGESQVTLDFQWKDFSDETNTQDGVFFSDDGGSNFVKVQDLPGASYANNVWNSFSLDLDNLASSNGLSLSSTFIVKFQHYDNYAIATDGFAFDEISVTGSGPPVNNPPVFTNDPFSKANATEGVAYGGSISGDATDADSDPLTFSKVSGPAWLSVAANGALSGTPGGGDVGANQFTVGVDDGNGGSDQAVMNITVDPATPTNNPPAFTSDPINKPNATEGQAYSESIGGDASDPDFDPLTFSKVSGPAWLSVASNGALSGTPGAGDVGANQFTVRVEDGNGGSDEADLNITVSPSGGTGAWQVLTYDDFESGWGNYVDGGSDCRRSARDAAYAHQGTYCVRIRDNTSTSNFAYSSGIDVTSYDEITVSFWYYPRSMDNSNEDFWVQFYDGSNWQTVATYARNTDFQNNNFYEVPREEIIISSSSYNFSNDMRIRFVCDASGNSDWVYIDEVEVAARTNTSIFGGLNLLTTGEVIPESFDLKQNYPNPFNPTTSIEYSVPEQSDISIKIYDISGSLVATLVNENKEPGIYTSVWDGRNQRGIRVASGIYIYRMVGQNFVQNKRMILLK